MINDRSEINIYNTDCLPEMMKMEDNQFDLAIVDPPYGIGVNKMTLGNGKTKIKRGANDWDKKPPPPEYFKQLFRVSKIQVIWGANNFVEYLTGKSGWLFWDKGTGNNDYSDGELAWTNLNGALRKINKSWVGANAKDEGKRIHPTQKPIYLYKWILQKYAKEGDKILDTHLGSGSIAIACWDMKFDLTGYELDEDYYRDAMKRIEQHTAQLQLF